MISQPEPCHGCLSNTLRIFKRSVLGHSLPSTALHGHLQDKGAEEDLLQASWNSHDECAAVFAIHTLSSRRLSHLCTGAASNFHHQATTEFLLILAPEHGGSNTRSQREAKALRLRPRPEAPSAPSPICIAQCMPTNNLLHFISESTP